MFLQFSVDAANKTIKPQTYSRVKVRVTGERTGGGTSCQSCGIGVISRGAGFTGREREREKKTFNLSVLVEMQLTAELRAFCPV